MNTPQYERALIVGAGVGLSAALWLGLGATTLAYLLFARGLRGSGVGQAATMGLAEPVTATVPSSLRTTSAGRRRCAW